MNLIQQVFTIISKIFDDFATFTKFKENFDINFLILAITAITGYKSVIKSAETNELTLLPVLTIRLHKKGDSDLNTCFFIKNYGHGVAYDIRILPHSVKFADSLTEWKYEVCVADKSFLAPAEEKALSISMKENGDLVTNTEFISYAVTGITIPFRIFFKNIRGDMYYSEIETTSSAVRILYPPHRLNILVFFLFIKFLYMQEVLNSIALQIKKTRIKKD